jgi:hypothetical protein
MLLPSSTCYRGLHTLMTYIIVLGCLTGSNGELVRRKSLIVSLEIHNQKQGGMLKRDPEHNRRVDIFVGFTDDGNRWCECP